ncbi:MAG: DUF1015 domain-containing protein [Spirochaetia bacterium]|nr:DUF1015 domain-containing protein [Spirochaetia bacterium]
MDTLKTAGVGIPEIYVPDQTKTTFEKWAVIAGDQFTSNKKYWAETKEIACGSPSTLNLFLPEVYLKEVDLDKTIPEINKTMDKYLADGTLQKLPAGFMLVERETDFSPARIGLLVNLDLDQYDYSVGTDSLIQPTEKTVVERLPVRVKIRQGAALDMPHILVFIDDHDEQLIETLYSQRDSFKKIYDFKLMQNGGHLRGWHIPATDPAMRSITEKFLALKAKNHPLFAMGDGNHSLAAAKNTWEAIKAKGVSDHPARWAMAEVVNINSPGIIFHPIHKVMFGVDTCALMDALKRELKCSVREVCRCQLKASEDPMEIYAVTKDKAMVITLEGDNILAAEELQNFLDKYMKENASASIDYIHGEKDLEELAQKDAAIGFLLPEISKKTFFRRLSTKGVYPRKTFSIGESYEKRYYLESQKIR